MKIWVYEGSSVNGEITTGEIKASSALMAQIALRGNGVSIIRIHELQKNRRFWDSINRVTKKKKISTNNLLDKIDINKLKTATAHKDKSVSKENPIAKKEVYVFIRQFAVIIKSGIPLIKAFDIVIKGQENRKFAMVLNNIKGSVESGISLTNSFAKYPKIFDSLFINFLAMGEQGGVLDIL